MPRQHRSSDYEGPLIAVFKARHLQVGSKVAALTAELFKDEDFGYFRLPDPFDGNVAVAGSTVRLLVVHQDKVKTATDWCLDENCTLGAALVSESLGFKQELFPVLKTVMPLKDFELVYVTHDKSFELPSAADSFPQPKAYEAPGETEGTSSSAASSTGVLVQLPTKPRKSIEGQVIPIP